jgi:hypothetical protein
MSALMSSCYEVKPWPQQVEYGLNPSRGPVICFVQSRWKLISNMSGTQPSTITEFCLGGVPTETCRQLCWYVLVDTLPK